MVFEEIGEIEELFVCSLELFSLMKCTILLNGTWSRIENRKRFYKILIDENTHMNTNPHYRVFVDMGRIESNLFIKKYLCIDVINKSSDYLIFTNEIKCY